MVGAEEEILELNNGCICCTVRGDLTRAVCNLMARGGGIDRIVIETTGLADPAPVIQSFILEETLRSSTELDAVVTVVDARHIYQQLDNEQAREQIAFADIIILNTIDLVSERGLDSVVRRLRSLNPLARIYWATQCDVDLQHVLDVGAFDLRNALKLEPQLLDDIAHEHDADIGCVSIREPGRMDETRFTPVDQSACSGPGQGLVEDQGHYRPGRRGAAVRLPWRPHDAGRAPWKAMEARRATGKRTGNHR